MQAGSIFLKNWGRAGRAVVVGGGGTDWHPPQKKTPKKTTTNNIVNLQNSNPRLNSPWCEKKWRRGLFLDARKICPLFRKLLLALLDCDKYRIIQVFSDESCADPDNFFPGGFRDIFFGIFRNLNFQGAWTPESLLDQGMLHVIDFSYAIYCYIKRHHKVQSERKWVTVPTKQNCGCSVETKLWCSDETKSCSNETKLGK